eukprot:3858243-Prymnesium_polylepis.1
MWKPCVSKLIDEVEKVLLSSIIPIKAIPGVSDRLCNTIQAKWAAQSVVLIRNFKQESLAALKEERDFGTMNHYLSDKYVAETLLPEGMLQKCVN